MIDIADLEAWIGQTVDLDRGVRCINASVARLSQRCTLPDPWTEDINTAALLMASRLYQRRQTPEGVAAIGEMGAVRITSFDPDVEALLLPYLKTGFA